jgi:hypothetical protein
MGPARRLRKTMAIDMRDGYANQATGDQWMAGVACASEATRVSG